MEIGAGIGHQGESDAVLTVQELLFLQGPESFPADPALIAVMGLNPDPGFGAGFQETNRPAGEDFVGLGTDAPDGGGSA